MFTFNIQQPWQKKKLTKKKNKQKPKDDQYKLFISLFFKGLFRYQRHNLFLFQVNQT